MLLIINYYFVSKVTVSKDGSTMDQDIYATPTDNDDIINNTIIKPEDNEQQGMLIIDHTHLLIN